MRDRYSIVVGLLFAAVVVIALLNTRGGENGGTLGLDEQPHLWPLPEFAVPVAASELEGDANVAQDDCETSQVPCPEEAQRTPACRVPGADVIRVCDFFDRPLVVSFWFSKGGGTCVEQQDAVNAAYRRYRERVGFLSLNVRDDRDTVRDLIRERGWEMPVGYDHDGAVASLYRVGICPTFAYVYRGGVLQSASIGYLSVAQLGAHVQELLAATRKTEERG
jgi:redoxin